MIVVRTRRRPLKITYDAMVLDPAVDAKVRIVHETTLS
jgi:hypothetical protein